MATERLEIEIIARADKFKSELNKAQLALNELEQKALKAGGGTDKLNLKIKQARTTVRQMRLEYQKATLDLKMHASQAIKTAGATTKLGKSQKRSNMALTQFAYAIDDMQYGFQGVMNNIQAMAVSMGAGGPLIIGLTAAVVTIGYFVKKLEKANRAAKEAKKVLKDADGLIAAQMLYAQAVKDSTSSTETQAEALKKLKDQGYNPATQSIDDYIAKLREQAKIESEVAMHQSKVQDLLEKEREAREALTEAKDPSNFRKSVDEFIALMANPMGSGMTDEEYAEKLHKDRIKNLEEERDAALAATKAYLEANIINTTGGTDTTLKDQLIKSKELAEEIDAIVEDILTKGQPLLDQEIIDVGDKLFGKGGHFEDVGDQDTGFIDMDAVDLDDDTEAYLENLRRMIEATDSLRDNVGGAFADLGNIIATNLGRSGDVLSSFLGAAIGTYTKLLSANKVFLAKLIPLKKTEAAVNATAAATETASKVPFGAFVLPALIGGALAAVSSAFSSAGAGGVSSGGGGGNASTTVATPAQQTPVRGDQNSRIRGGDLLIPLDQIRYGQQIAGDNYTSFN